MSTIYGAQAPRGRGHEGQGGEPAERPAQGENPNGEKSNGEGAGAARGKRRRALTVAAALLVVATAAAVMPFTPALPVKGIDVEGTSHLSPEEVRSAAGVAEGTPMGRVDVGAAAAGVAGIPWVKSATVKRHWPSSVDVEVVEHVAVAYVEQGDGTHLIDPEGREFTVDAPPPGAIKIAGEAVGDEAVRADAVAVATSISERVRGQVMSIEAKGNHNFVLKLADDRTVVWGAAEDNANKALALETVLQREGREFNVTNPELVTVR
ncbi:cell division protein FtsQ/DivIB [uncultured Corynebacterium sp.]|uniref:cell division protein FtsQ/DivIB n=1 Tax=uncultured Corynebacterium sp. TaxID=159447 RepID=UPI002591C7B4|nr:FtsQ-type POTRA domain-containing protein [uncultured Corynebacterium sp.]